MDTQQLDSWRYTRCLLGSEAQPALGSIIGSQDFISSISEHVLGLDNSIMNIVILPSASSL